MTVMVTCAVVFVAFTFLWLFSFQSDLLAYIQHVLSNGHTTYNRTIGAVVITLLLWLVQVIVCRFVVSRGRAYALTFFPSMLLLAMLTSLGTEEGVRFNFGTWLWLLPLLVLLWGISLWGAHSLRGIGVPKESGLFSRRMWINMLTMVLMMVGVAWTANTNAVFHYALRAETAMIAGDYDQALSVGNRSLETDGNLMMLRMYALSRKGQLGDRLFHYPLMPTSAEMLPTDGSVTMRMYPVDSLYRHLGAIPRPYMKPMEYLETIIRSRQAKPAAHDYLLCGFLIDKNLDDFARNLPLYYTVNDSLPHHYREALVLYTHQRSNPVLVYHDAVLDVDYDDMQQLEATCKDDSERKGRVLEHYSNSYWYYYFYVN